MATKPKPKAAPKAKQDKTVARVMHAFKDGDLRSSAGTPVKNPKQAIAIALSESGQSRPDPSKSKRSKPKAK